MLKQFPKAQEEILENSQPNVYYLNWIVFVDKVGDDYHQLQESFPEYSVKRCDSLKELKLIPSKEVSIKVVFAVVSNLSNEEFIGISEYCSKSMKLFFPIVDRDFDLTRIASIPFTDSVRKPYLTSIIAKRVLHDVSSNEEELIAKNDSMQQAIFDMKMKAEQDSLTGLLNRAEFENKVNNYFSTSVNSPGIFIMIDIDNFKQLNDESGHLSGDKALISVANALRNLFQDSFIGRLGGDEFAVVITHNYDSNLLNKNLSIVCQSLTQYNHAIGVTCSAGIAFAPLQGNTFQKLYKNADIALLHAKNKGKSMYVFFEDGMKLQSMRNLRNKH